MKKLLHVQPACLPDEEWLRLTLLETLSSSCANMLSLPQGSMLQVALRTQGVTEGVQADCFFFFKGTTRKGIKGKRNALYVSSVDGFN